ncbi:MAG: hypothetical protein EBZ75_15430, partial [Oxalobacteraceae bacterium]|nr:hypothetical protein [Oxalobacteraceae bacterium]
FSGAIVLVDWDFRVPLLQSPRVRHLAQDLGRVSTGQFLAMAQRSDLLIGVDSGPLHAAIFTDVPVLGVFHAHYPTCVTLPNPRAAFMTRGITDYPTVNRAHRARWSIIEYAGVHPTGAEIARHALRMLEGPRYLTKARFGRDVLLQQFVRDWLASGGRQHTMDTVLRLTSKRFQAPNIVETGCQEKPEDWQSGSSTYIWGAYLDGRGVGHLSSVMRTAEHLAAARAIGAPWGERISYHTADPVRWLGQYRQPIDVLCLRSTPADAPAAAECALQEFQTALPKLSPDALVIVDDVQWDGVWGERGSGCYVGRAEKVLPFAFENGWRVLACDVQIVLSRAASKEYLYVS